MVQKGVYPYEYMDGWEKFEETSLTPEGAFYSRLNMKGISDQDYKHAQQIWNRITPGHENITLGGVTMTFTLQQMFYFWQTCLRHCGIRA